MSLPTLTAATLLTAGLAEAAVLDALWTWLPTARFDPRNAIGFALLTGLVIFATTTASLHLRERSRWMRRERTLSAEIAALREIRDRFEIVLGAERQLIISWSGRNDDPIVQGDPTILGPKHQRALAFGSWLPASDALALENAVETLRERGAAFRLVVRPSADRLIEVEGRTVSSRALLRLREITGDRLESLRTGEQLARAEAEFKTLHALFDAIPQPVWLRQGDGSLGWVNRAYLAAVEADGIDDLRQRGLELLDRGVREDATRRRLVGEAYSGRVAAVVAGSRRVLDIVEKPTVDGSAGIAVDVSELESVRADLQRQMDAHVRTLDRLPTAVAMFDAKQRLVFSNTAYRQLWGLDQAFLDSRPLDGEILDRLRAARKLPEQADFRSWKASLLAGYRAVEPQEAWWHLPDLRTLRVVANPNPQGGLTYLFDDVSEHMRLESRYNALMRVQSETLDTLKEGVAVFGTDGRLKFANRAFGDLWNLPGDWLAEQPHIDQIVGHCRMLAPQEQPWLEIRSAVAGLMDRRLGIACRIERRDGTVLDCGAQPLPDGATLLSFIDVTASVNVERALTERNEALERASRLRDDFVHHVSYELRSPLTTIIGFTQLLGDETVGPLNERQREYAGHIMRSSGALLAIINDILDLASIDTGLVEIEWETIDVRGTIEAAVRGVEDRLAESSLRLELDVPPDIGTFVADGKRVRQILFNLLSNAIGFSAPGQTVRVSARKAGGEIALQVHDEGRGIPAEVKARVFDRFETHTLGTRHRGVGLGLSMVRSFVELHGGRVELVSAPGAGTTVTCFFPTDGGAQRLAAE